MAPDMRPSRGVHSRQNVVKYDNGRLGIHGPRKSDALALSSAERDPTVSDDLLIPMLERCNVPVKTGDDTQGMIVAHRIDSAVVLPVLRSTRTHQQAERTVAYHAGR